jgi:hypothetical protein
LYRSILVTSKGGQAENGQTSDHQR